jgi:hypothetical protein
MGVNSVNPCATAAVTNGGTLFGMQGMFGVYQKAPIEGECYLTLWESDRSTRASRAQRFRWRGSARTSAIRRKAAALPQSGRGSERYRTRRSKESVSSNPRSCTASPIRFSVTHVGCKTSTILCCWWLSDPQMQGMFAASIIPQF